MKRRCNCAPMTLTLSSIATLSSARSMHSSSSGTLIKIPIRTRINRTKGLGSQVSRRPGVSVHREVSRRPAVDLRRGLSPRQEISLHRGGSPRRETSPRRARASHNQVMMQHETPKISARRAR